MIRTRKAILLYFEKKKQTGFKHKFAWIRKENTVPMDRYTILIVEDDPVIRSQLQTLLRGAGYETAAPADLCDVAGQVRRLQPHLVLLDIKLPGESGFAICSAIRSFSDLPVMIVTSSDTEMDELNSLLLGADAFVTKPYNTAILLAKIAALLRRAYPAHPDTGLCWQGATLHPESGRLEYKGRTVELTKTEGHILYCLFRRAGQICTRAEIIDALWDSQLYVDDNALSVNISRIRDKLGSIGLEGFIKTKHRQGYLL